MIWVFLVSAPPLSSRWVVSPEISGLSSFGGLINLPREITTKNMCYIHVFKVTIGMDNVLCNTNFVQVYVVPTITDFTVHATLGTHIAAHSILVVLLRLLCILLHVIIVISGALYIWLGITH